MKVQKQSRANEKFDAHRRLLTQPGTMGIGFTKVIGYSPINGWYVKDYAKHTLKYISNHVAALVIDATFQGITI